MTINPIKARLASLQGPLEPAPEPPQLDPQAQARAQLMKRRINKLLSMRITPVQPSMNPADALVHWLQERERIRIAREQGKPPPWTDDPILANYRFCNVRREDDRVTQWIDRNIRKPYATAPMLPVMLTLCRFINREETLDNLVTTESWPTHDKYEPARVWVHLERRAQVGLPVFGPAYVIRAESNRDRPWFSWSKARYVAEIVAGGVLHKLPYMIHPQEHEAWFESTFCHLLACYGFGEFMAFQVAVDLRHTPFLDNPYTNDLKTFVAFGPGTRRGINRMCERPLNATVSRTQLLLELSVIQEYIKDTTGLELEPYDVANCMCEIDKYLRGGGKQRYHPQQSRN